MARRDRSVESIRHHILASGREIFSRHPYSEVSDGQICKHAGITRGALQHHFGSKRGLFMSVFEGLQHGVFVRMTGAIGQHQEPWERVRAAIAALLDACAQPAYQTVVLREGPAAIGWERWLELDTAYYGELVQTIIDMLAPTGLGDGAAGMLVATMRGALSELSFEIAQAVDKGLARRQALAIVDCLLSSYRETLTNHIPTQPVSIGIRELRNYLVVYLDRVADGEVIDVTRRGRV